MFVQALPDLGSSKWERSTLTVFKLFKILHPFWWMQDFFFFDLEEIEICPGGGGHFSLYTGVYNLAVMSTQKAPHTMIKSKEIAVKNNSSIRSLFFNKIYWFGILNCVSYTAVRWQNCGEFSFPFPGCSHVPSWDCHGLTILSVAIVCRSEPKPLYSLSLTVPVSCLCSFLTATSPQCERLWFC